MEINQELKEKEGNVRFQGVSWKSLLNTRAGTSRLLVHKFVVRGLGLERGTPIYSYLAEDESGRPVMISYLDGKHRVIKEQEDGTKETV